MKKGHVIMPPNNREKKYTEFIRLRLTKEQTAKLQALCDYKQTTISMECRNAIEQYLQNVHNVALPIALEYFAKK